MPMTITKFRRCVAARLLSAEFDDLAHDVLRATDAEIEALQTRCPRWQDAAYLVAKCIIPWQRLPRVPQSV